MPIKNAYTDLKASLQALLTTHNKALPKDVQKLEVKSIIDRLITEGGTNEKGLRSFSRQDLVDFGFPRALATQGFDLLHEDMSVAPETTKKTGAKKASAAPGVMMLRNEADALRTMSVYDLVKGFDPNNPGLVGDELLSRAKTIAVSNEDMIRGRAFLVYADPTATKLDRKSSASYLQSMLDGVPVTDYVMVDGEPITPLRVGDRPNMVLAENPLYRGRALRQPNDVCEMTNESYDGIAHDVRELLAVAATPLPGAPSAELRISDPEMARNVITSARLPNALAILKGRYPRSAAALRNMTPNEKPTLLLKPNRSQPVGGGARPPFSG